MASGMKHLSFNMSVPVSDRVAVLSPVINSMVEEHDSGEAVVGVEAFQEDIIERIRSAGLLESKWLQVDHVGVHPDNREKAMLVPIDVHDLLKRMANDGWSYKKWEAMACEIPAGPVGEAWRKMNERLAEGSDGMLAPYQGDMLEVLTGRGSHGTAALRAMKVGAKGVHPEVCAEGYVSKSKICERQPSMEQPCSKGCPYDVIKAELVVACPRLMEVLSRTGNAGHSVYRVQTALQHCNRLHQLALSRQSAGKDVDWDSIAKQACIGMGDEFLDDAKKLAEFVRAWSGGEDGFILKDLEAYERTLKVKRKLYPHDLQLLGKIDFMDGSRYVPAMVKAMLNAPTADSTGHAALFTNSDFSSLQPNAKGRPFAKEASDMMDSATSFLKAYSRLEPTVQKKLVSDLEVRCVMHVHQKKCETRASYKSLLNIANAMYDEAKTLDDKLPVWTKLSSVDTTTATTKVPTGFLREIRKDGLIADCEMSSRGFVVGAQVAKKGGDGVVYSVVALDKECKTVTLKPEPQEGNEEGEPEDIEVGRQEIVSSWAVHVVEQELSYTFGNYPDPSMYSDMVADVWKGYIKAALIDAFKKSSESKVLVHKEPALKVVAGKSFKEGTLNLVGLTNNISIASSSKNSSGVLALGECFEHPTSGTMMKAFARSHLQFPSPSIASGFARNALEPFIVAYWVCQETYDISKVNCRSSIEEGTVKIGGVAHKIGIPTITNTHALKEGDELVVLKTSSGHEPPQSNEVEDAKRQKVSQPSKGNKGKGKGKSKSKGKSSK